MNLASSNLIVTLIIGGVIGWLASILMKTNAQMGILANVIVGIIGSFLGVFVANALGVQAHTTPAAWIVASFSNWPRANGSTSTSTSSFSPRRA